MAKWWETDMVNAGQMLYSDPELALQVATMPDRAVMSPEEYQKTLKASQEDKGGFMNTIMHGIDKIDGAIKNVLPTPVYNGWKSTLEGLWYPVDKLAQGARWLYSEGFSQPVSTLFLQFAKADVNSDYGTLFRSSEWADAYGKAENLSPGQSFVNYENTIRATGDAGAFAGIFTNDLKFTPEEQDQLKRQTERFLYDKDFWRRKDEVTYTRGTGALDFYFVMFGDPTALITGGAANAVKATRSAQFVDDGVGELVRTKGNFLDVVSPKAPQTLTEYSTGNQMNKFYDWIAQPGLTGQTKSAAEIAAHPIWGSGRRTNPFKDQWGQALSQASRDEMPLIMRFSLGDTNAAKELAARGGQTLDNVGRLSDNRKLLDSVRFDDEMVSYFAQKQAGVPVSQITQQGTNTRLFEPPFPRPTTPGPRQAGWDARWGSLAQQAEVHAEAVAATGLNNVRGMGPLGGVSASDMANITAWRDGRVQMITDEMTRLQASNKPIAIMLGSNLGKSADELKISDMNMFGSLDRAFRMGTERGAGAAGARAETKFERSVLNRKGRFEVQGYRQGFYGTPLRVVQAFGDRVPAGRVNHNDDDAADRVLDMLKQVPGLNPEVRAGMLDSYIMAGDKVRRSQQLAKIQSDVIRHMATRVHGLDPEVAGVIDRMIEVGVGKTMSELTGGKTNFAKQAFSAAEVGGRKVDHIADGEATIVAPLAKTQLSMTDTLLPLKELDDILSRNSGAMRQLRKAGASAMDTVNTLADSFNTLWKASTLLRPAYTPRMISEEWFASAIKFGALSRLLADPSIGAKNFVRNRVTQVGAELGLASHVPTTGAGAESSLAVLKLGDENIAGWVSSRRSEIQDLLKTATGADKARLEQELGAIKTKRIRVNKALPIVQNRISMEKELASNLEADIAGWNKEIQKLKGSQLIQDQLRRQGLQDKVDNARDAILDHNNVIAEHLDYADEIMRAAVKAEGARLGTGEFEAFGRKIPQAFSKRWENTISRESLSSDTAYQTMYARGEAIDTGRAIRTGSWEYITPDQPNHMDAWLRGINFQFRQDPVFRLLAEDASGKSAMQWLATPEGKVHLGDLGGLRSPGELVTAVKATLDKYLPNAELQQKMARGEEISPADLRATFSQKEFPVVHGEEMKYPTRLSHKDTAASIVDRIVAKGFKRLGSIPSDLMSRHPVYARAFEARFRTVMQQEMRYKQTGAESLTPAELESIKAKADVLARKDISQVVYDPKRTTAGEALRFIFPFYSAHADSLSRWAGLIAEKPQTVGTIAKIYNAPVAANLITDDQGNPVGLDGMVTKKVPVVKVDPVTGKKVVTGEEIKREKVHINDRVFHLRNPWAVKSEGDLPIKLSAMNTILPGDPWFNPGTGPVVQILGSQIAKASPQTGDFLQWAKILPYGPSDVSTAITPKYMRSAWAAWKGDDPDNEEYQKAYLAVYNRKVAEFHEGGEKFTLKDVENEAKKFLFLDFLVAWGSPAQTQQTPITGTKYQFFVDAYSQLRDADPQNAKDLFMERYGPDYFQFTSSLTKSMGIAATNSADKMATKYKDLLDMDPEMAPFIIGNVYNNGAFSRSVYMKQLEQSFGSEWVREKITAKDAIAQNQIDQGWSEYRGLKTELDSMLLRTGFTSYTQKGAEKLNQMRANIVDSLGKDYPAWGEAFATTDRAKIPNRIASFERLVQDERFQQDPMRESEIQNLMKYLYARRIFKDQLAKRGAKELSFSPNGQPIGKNADLGMMWNTTVTQLINDSTQFGDLYNRYLQSDHLQG